MTTRPTPRPAVAEARTSADPAHAPGKEHLLRDATAAERRDAAREEQYQHERGNAADEQLRNKRMRRGR